MVRKLRFFGRCGDRDQIIFWRLILYDMSCAIYFINKGVNQAITFKGFKGQYISYAAFGLVGLLLTVALLFFIGLSPYVCLLTVGVCGMVLVRRLSYLSRTYGQFGMLKLLARRKMPSSLRCQSRALFIDPKRQFNPTSL